MVALILTMFMKHEGSLTCPKKLATVPCPDPEDSGPNSTLIPSYRFPILKK
jgi:hypothetical protein